LLKRAEGRWQDASLKVALGDSWQANNLGKVQQFWADEIERLRVELRGVIQASEAPPESR
jgi:hypothetical protein